MLTLDRIRGLIEQPELSDEEAAAIRDTYRSLALLAIERLQESRESDNNKNKLWKRKSS